MLRIRLLGRPSAEMDGVVGAGPRGRKPWALLAVLLLADSAPSRSGLAALLFPDAHDPLGALRWTISQLRRGLANHVRIDGDPVVLSLGPECRVDILEVLANSREVMRDVNRADVADWAAGSEPLLVGADGIAGPDFDLWLTSARHRVDAARAARLRGAAQRALSAGEPATAVTAAARAVAAEPYHADGRAALVSSLVAAGDHAAALAQLREWSALIRRELQLTQLLGERHNAAADPGQQDTDTMSRIEAGKAALAAGAATAGLEHLRDAVRLATSREDESVQANALLALGGGLVHSLAAHCDEGTKALREAARLARRAGAHRVAAEALRDLAYVENAAGRASPARRLLSSAAAAADDDSYVMSGVRGMEGMFLADRGQHGRAQRVLRRSAELAERAGRFRQVAWALSISSRSLLQQNELDSAAEHAHRGAQIVADEHWIAMQPYFDVVIAELELASGQTAEAKQRLRRAWSLSLVLGDWCWQGLAARGLGLVAFARGDIEQALRWLDEASRRAGRPDDRYAWIHAWVHEAICRVTVAAELPRATSDVRRLAAIAAESNQPDFLVRADLLGVGLGQPSALARARAVAATIDNPALSRMTALPTRGAVRPAG